jgi:hypothetical protein
VVAAWASSASAISRPQTFSLLEVSTPNSEHPLGDVTFDRPPRGGDSFAITNQLYKWAGTKRGARAGHDEVVITFVTDFGPNFSHPATVLIVGQVFLQGGSLLAQGYGRVNPDGPARFTLPIVGGTGTYANARGYLKTRDLGNGQQDKTNLEFHLVG